MVSITFGYSNKRLFSDRDLSDDLREHFAQVTSLVEKISKGEFLSSSEEQVFEHIFCKLRVNPITLYGDEMRRDEPEETRVRGGSGVVPGFSMMVSIPYSGDSELWVLKPSGSWPTVPYGAIRPPEGNSSVGYLDIILKYDYTTPSNDIERDLRNNIDEIKSYLELQRSDVEKHNEELARRIRVAISTRRGQLERLGGIVNRLNIPLQRRGDAPRFLPLEERRKAVPSLSPAVKEASEALYGISDEVYTHILSVIRHEGRTFETTPCTYFVHDEEGLRDIILAHLNGHYEGAATGETFRGKGKTDIRIEEEGRSAFVAECKVWYGQQRLSRAVDQLLSYRTWRDCRAAMIVFNKHNARFTDLLKKVPEVVITHPSFSRDLGSSEDGEWRYVLACPGDEQQRIFVHVFLFNLHTDGACLTGANLQNADLRKADLRGCDLRGARHDERTRWPDGVYGTRKAGS